MAARGDGKGAGGPAEVPDGDRRASGIADQGEFRGAVGADLRRVRSGYGECDCDSAGGRADWVDAFCNGAESGALDPHFCFPR